MHRQITEYEAPDSSEYMHLKDRHRKLQQSILTWERKVGVGEVIFLSCGLIMCAVHSHKMLLQSPHFVLFHQLALKTYSTAWKEQRATLTPVNSAATRIRSGERQFSVKLPDIAEHKDKAYQLQ